MSSINKSRTHFIPKLGKRRKINPRNRTPNVPKPSDKAHEQEHINDENTKDTSGSALPKDMQKKPEVKAPEASEKQTEKEHDKDTTNTNGNPENSKGKNTVPNPLKEVPFSKLELARRPSLSSAIISRRNSSVSRSRRPSLFGVPSVKVGGSRRLSSLKSSNTTVNVGKQKSRRSSSNVLPPIFGSRRSSISSIRGGIPEVAAAETTEAESETKPVKISIPSAPPKRRRRSSAIASRRSSVAAETPNVKISASQMDNVLKDLEKVDENVVSRIESNAKPAKAAENKPESAKMQESSLDVGKVKKAKIEAKKEKELELTPAELKKGEKYYLDRKKNRIRKLKLSNGGSSAPMLENDTTVIADASQLKGLTHKDDAELLEKFVLDEKNFTIRDLCKPFFPIGKVSKDYKLAVTADKQRMSERAERRQKRLMARKMRIPFEKVEGEKEQKEEEQERRKKVKEFMDKEVNESDNHRMVPLLVTNDDGTVTYSHESTYVDRHSGTKNEGAMERVLENPYEHLVNSATYSKRRFAERWTAQETAEFYRALSMWGTDFGLISMLFPYRTRKQVKSKFNLEESKHPHLIEFALIRKLPGDIAEYSGKSGKTYKSLDYYESQLKDLRTKHDKEIKSLTAAKQKAQAEDRNNAKRISSIPTKVTAKSRKAVLMEFRKNEEVVGSIPPKQA
ncbi:hypothetical protein HII12_004788 [Brettanomyces bruxellensis]|uniref:Myb-like domain-containing protein n=1 Tax=Dekkera bruxellensis TaxID=5007 RepID=A0A8H6EQR3_DEKBR|nr:hypothetical protein HII12_004788 [Brettanomyces bruxellensis]